MYSKRSALAIAHEAAAHLAATIMVTRWRTTVPGDDGAAFPAKARWLATQSEGLMEWMGAGGFAMERAAQMKTAAQGRRSRVHIEDISEEW